MRALVVTKLGDPTQPLSADGPLTLSNKQPVPVMVSNGVRIRVTAAALNFADALQVQASNLEPGDFLKLLRHGGLQGVLQRCPVSTLCFRPRLGQGCARQPPQLALRLFP